MKKIRITLIFLTLITLSSLITLAAAPSSYSSDYQQTLEYRVTDWNGTTGVEWSWPNERGFLGTQRRGTIVVNFTGMYDKSGDLAWTAGPSSVPYGDISSKMRNGNLNFTATNVSVTEMAYVLLLGYSAFQPGFIIPLEWESNAAQALAQADGFFQANVTVTNKTNSVIYDFKQLTGSLLQNTTLEYNITNGVLLNAYTEFGNYWCELQLGGLFIPGFSLPTLGIVTIVTILGISLLVLNTKRKKR